MTADLPVPEPLDRDDILARFTDLLDTTGGDENDLTADLMAVFEDAEDYITGTLGLASIAAGEPTTSLDEVKRQMAPDEGGDLPEPRIDRIGELATELGEWHDALTRALPDPAALTAAARTIRDRLAALIAEWPQVVADIYGTPNPTATTPALPPAGRPAANSLEATS